MPYSQLPAELYYPPIDTSAWVVISKLTELPDRTVPSLQSVNHSSEFALPFPTGKFPSKTVSVSVSKQKFDDLGRPLYYDGSSDTTEDQDVDGNFYPPSLETIYEEKTVNLRDEPEYFSLKEVTDAVENDFLNKFPFYNWARLITFDDRYSSLPTFASKQGASGFASASHPFFVGPIPFETTITAPPEGIDPEDDPVPRAHLLLVAPELPGINWYWQRRHGSSTGGNTGPIEDIGQASRLGEIFRMVPMNNFPVMALYTLDADGVDNDKFWLRTGLNGTYIVNVPYPVVPFILLLGRSSGSA